MRRQSLLINLSFNLLLLRSTLFFLFAEKKIVAVIIGYLYLQEQIIARLMCETIFKSHFL